MTELKNAADEFFSRHIAAEKWAAYPEELREQALFCAEADVALYLDAIEVDASQEAEMYALYEQAIHLCEKAHAPEKRLVSEEISGVGRRTWEFRDRDAMPDYAPRAVRFMDAVRRRRFRLGRG